MSGKSDGYATLSVLVFLALVLPMVAAFANGARLAAATATARNDAFRFQLLAEGIGMAVASRLLDGGPKAIGFPSRDEPGICGEEGAVFSLEIVDHQGKISVNSASPDLLRAGFVAAGIALPDAEALADFVVASRQKDEATTRLPRLSGLPIKHAPFERVEEIDDAIAKLKLKPVDLGQFFTISRNEQTIDAQHADEALQKVLASEPTLKQYFAEHSDLSVFDLVIGVRGGADGAVRLALRMTMAKSDHGVNVLAETRTANIEEGATDVLPTISCQDLLTKKATSDG